MLLFLNDIAGSEDLLILIFILIFFGSKSIPGIAKTFGKTMYQIKQASNDLQEEIKKSGVDIKKDLNLTGFVNETTEIIQRPLDQQIVEMDNIIKYDPIKNNNSDEIETGISEKSNSSIVDESSLDSSTKENETKNNQ